LKIHIAGINHNDPLMRVKLHDWLERTASSITSPAFIALEWDQKLFAQVKAQRDRFYYMLLKEFPSATPEALSILRDSLGYEGDTHTKIFPNVEELWLDSGRNCSVDTYAEGRLSIYKSFLKKASLSTVDYLSLERFSMIAANRASLLSAIDKSRDRTFAELIAQRISGGIGSAIAIVGSLHACNDTDSMVELLRRQGYFCDITIF
jgi:hypothetical protein